MLLHVFDRFYKANTDDTVPGFGIGVPIAKALAKRQGGRISFESEVNRGSIVRVYLPKSNHSLEVSHTAL